MMTHVSKPSTFAGGMGAVRFGHSAGRAISRMMIHQPSRNPAI